MQSFIAILTLLSAFVLAACQQTTEKNVNNEIASIASAPTNNTLNIGWKYQKSVDEMRGKTSYFASILSSNELDIGRPYGKVKLELTFFNENNTEYSPNAIIRLYPKGLINCGTSMKSCVISYKADNDKVSEIPAAHLPSNLEAIFVGNDLEDNYNVNVKAKYAKVKLNNLAFYSEISTSKKAIIEVNIYGYGTAQFKFDTAGLKPYEEWVKSYKPEENKPKELNEKK